MPTTRNQTPPQTPQFNLDFSELTGGTELVFHDTNELINELDRRRRHVVSMVVGIVIMLYWVGVGFSAFGLTFFTAIDIMIIMLMSLDVLTGLKTLGGAFGIGALLNLPDLQLNTLLPGNGPFQLPNFELKKTAEGGWTFAVKNLGVPVISMMVVVSLLLLLFVFFRLPLQPCVWWAFMIPPMVMALSIGIMVLTKDLTGKTALISRSIGYGLMGIILVASLVLAYGGAEKIKASSQGTPQTATTVVAPTTASRQSVQPAATQSTDDDYTVHYAIPQGTSLGELPAVNLPDGMPHGKYEVLIKGTPRVTMHRPGADGGTVDESGSLYGEATCTDVTRTDIGAWGIIIGNAKPGQEGVTKGGTFTYDQKFPAVELNIPKRFKAHFDNFEWTGEIPPLDIVFRRIK
ncbi:MAG: hypothetical protein HGA31_04595 [Candidatus Moranbacteria bacterium]|nr:hypothetical protein [Candidatus Moranbacteria bacterium]